MARGAAMTAPHFIPLAEAYLALRHSLGFSLVTQAGLLLDFARYADETAEAGPLTLDLAVQWAKSSKKPCPSNLSRRLTIVRGFAKYCAGVEPETEIPPIRMFGPWARRAEPHIYSDTEISDLLKAMSHLRPRRGLRPLTYVTLFSLLVSTGLRISEACNLKVDDVDLEQGLLVVLEGKFRKSRLVPLHPSAINPLKQYLARRSASAMAKTSKYFFITDASPRLTGKGVCVQFWWMRKRLGWTAEGRTRVPRIHDIRHRFATVRLLRWHEEGGDLEQKLVALATYLGHVMVSQSYWYLSGVPELMAITGQRFQQFTETKGGTRP